MFLSYMRIVGGLAGWFAPDMRPMHARWSGMLSDVVGNGASLFEAGHSSEEGPSLSIQKGRIPLLLSFRRSSQQESSSCCDPGFVVDSCGEEVRFRRSPQDRRRVRHHRKRSEGAWSHQGSSYLDASQKVCEGEGPGLGG
jgi:hypothetical protein